MKLDQLDLAPHGYRSIHTHMRGAVATWSEPRFRAQLGADLKTSEVVTNDATVAELRAFVEGQGRLPCHGRELVTQVHCLLIDLWWPKKEMPMGNLDANTPDPEHSAPCNAT